MHKKIPQFRGIFIYIQAILTQPLHQVQYKRDWQAQH